MKIIPNPNAYDELQYLSEPTDGAFYNYFLRINQTTPQTITGDTPKLDTLKSKTILGTDTDGKIIEGTHQSLAGLVPYTGANANVDLGTYNLLTTGSLGAGAITALNYISDVALGTQPYACTSTTLNTNLNADLWDGYQFSDYLDQAVKVASTPQFTRLGIGAAADADDELYVKLGSVQFNATADVYSKISSGAYIVTRTGDTNPALQTYISASGVQEGEPRYVVSISGKNSWGDGTNAVDTNLYRSAANVLKTDDSFAVGGSAITCSGANTVLSFTSGWSKIENSSGTLYINYDNPTKSVQIGKTANSLNLSLYGQMGIGTNAPVGPLYVLGTAFSTTYNSFTGLTIDSSLVTGGAGNYSTPIEFTPLGSAVGVKKKAAIAGYQSGADHDTMGLSFFVGNSGVNTAPVIEGARMMYQGGLDLGQFYLQFGSAIGTNDTNLYRSAANVLKTDDAFQAASYAVGTTPGIDTTFVDNDGNTITVTKGIITSKVAP